MSSEDETMTCFCFPYFFTRNPPRTRSPQNPEYPHGSRLVPSWDRLLRTITTTYWYHHTTTTPLMVPGWYDE